MEETTLGAIHRLDQEIGEGKTELKKLNDTINDEVIQNAVYQKLEEAQATVATLKQQLKNDLMGSSSYNNLLSEKQELQFKLKDLQEILSHHLLQYQREHDNDSQVPQPDNKHAKQIIVKAKLSAKEDFYQERMAFDPATAGNRSYAISDGKTKTTISKDGIKTKPVKGGKK